MKKVLILAYDFPPYVSVGGLRPYSWAKYFHLYGVYPIIITRQWSNKHKNHLDYIDNCENNFTVKEENEKYCIYRTTYTPNLSNRFLLKYGENKYRILRRLITAYYEIFQWFFNIGTKITLYQFARKYLKENKVDFIIATGSPFILFRYAAKLSSEFKIPWIADYRDPWTQNVRYRKFSLIKVFNKFIEKKYLKSVSSITTVSSFFKELISSIVKHNNIHIITNGFDLEFAKDAKDKKQTSDFLTIGFAGTIQEWDPIKQFLSTIQTFNSLYERKIQLNFYGVNPNQIINNLIDTEFVELKKHINIEPKLPISELMKKLASCNLLLLFNYYNFHGTKIYDYLSIKRKILLCFENDIEANKLKSRYYFVKKGISVNSNAQIDIINKTNSGIIITDSEHLLQVLPELYDQLLANKEIYCNSNNISEYSRCGQAKIFVENVINNL